MKKNLNKLYGKLSPQEFASLSYNFCMKQEHEALDELHSTERTFEHCRETHYRFTAFNMLSASHQIEQLNCFITCALIKLAIVQSARESGTLSEKDRAKLQEAAILAYAFKIKKEGWHLFCEQLGIDPSLASDGFGAAPFLELADTCLADFEVPTDYIEQALAKDQNIEGEVKLATAESWVKFYTENYEKHLKP